MCNIISSVRQELSSRGTKSIILFFCAVVLSRHYFVFTLYNQWLTFIPSCISGLSELKAINVGGGGNLLAKV